MEHVSIGINIQYREHREHGRANAYLGRLTVDDEQGFAPRGLSRFAKRAWRPGGWLAEHTTW